MLFFLTLKKLSKNLEFCLKNTIFALINYVENIWLTTAMDLVGGWIDWKHYFHF
jgi:hypothetical protein